VAATLNWENRSSRRTRRSSRWSSGEKSATSPAIRDLNMEGSKRVIHRMADSRRIRPSQSPSTPSPMGVMAPMPVITTLRGELIVPRSLPPGA
jgi:hypothetical protein